MAQETATEPPQSATPPMSDQHPHSESSPANGSDKPGSGADSPPQEPMTGTSNGNDKVDPNQDAAARILQTRYRDYQSRLPDNGLTLSSSARWADALKNQRFASNAEEASKGQNDTSSRWQRGGFYAGRLVEGGGGGNNDDGGQGGAPAEMEGTARDAPGKAQKLMDQKYWLEMADPKHRYASNLISYHTYWNKHYSGDQNFFYWLDHGDGKDINLDDECPRSRLNSEKIMYLSAEQRLNYLVKINSDGLLVWARDGRKVDTARGRHKDLGNGRGIADVDQAEYDHLKQSGELGSSSSSSSSSDSGSDIEAGAHHYNADGSERSGLKAKMKDLFTPKLVMDHLLRKTLSKNVWIFVCDLRGNLYVGIKQTGKFQHSSFLYGSRVMAAGLIKVNEGRLWSLSPLSGHYRAGTVHFKGFVESLEEGGCDMTHVSISKSLLTIAALEKYGRFSKRKSQAMHRIKRRVKHPRHRDTPGESDSDSDKTPEEKHDSELNKRVKNDATKRKVMGTGTGMGLGQVACDAGEVERTNLEKVKRGGEKGVLPHQGKKKEEMSDRERVERGAALIVRAMSRGLKDSSSQDKSAPLKPDDSVSQDHPASPDQQFSNPPKQNGSKSQDQSAPPGEQQNTSTTADAPTVVPKDKKTSVPLETETSTTKST